MDEWTEVWGVRLDTDWPVNGTLVTVQNAEDGHLWAKMADADMMRSRTIWRKLLVAKKWKHGDTWVMDIAYHLDVYTVVHNESSHPSIRIYRAPTMTAIYHPFYGSLEIIYALEMEIGFQTLFISIVFHTLKRNKPLLMNTHCVLGMWGQTVHSEATRGSSKRDDKIISTQHSLHKYGASWWELQLAEEPIKGESPTPLQDSTTHPPPPDTGELVNPKSHVS